MKLKSIFFNLFLMMLLLITSPTAYAQTAYYISSLGNDANSGTSISSPWKTINKINSTTFSANSQIYFKCGEKFQGQLNLSQSNITVGSYGTGNKPVITGAESLSGWTVYNGSIYVAQASSFINNLYSNGTQMTLARYPNAGFLSITSKQSGTTFASTGITQASGYWNGANCRLRTNGWTFESQKVSTQTGTTLILTSAPYFANTFGVGWGFYLDNKLAALDAPGEWYCDPANNKVYFYAPGSVNPNNLTVTGSTLDYGVNSSSNYITVRDLEFHYQSKAGLNFTGSNISLLSNTVYGGLANGIDIRGTNCTIDGNIIQNVNANGIHSYYTTKDGTITNNTIKSVGLVQGYQNEATAYGILSEGTYTTISNNYLDSVGYDGIYAFSHDLVEKNIIKNTMLTLSDGSAIYIGTGASYVTIQNNFISDAFGNNGGTSFPNQDWSGANGIYLDGGSNNSIAKDNTIIRAKSSAIFINYSTSNHTVTNNTAYDCASVLGGYFLFLNFNVSSNDGGHSITNNIFYPASSNQKLVQIQNESASFYSPTVIMNNNYFLNTRGNTTPFETQLHKSSGWWIDKYTFAAWKSLTGLEANSKYIITESNKRDTIIVNGTSSPITVNLPSTSYYDLDGNVVSGSFVIAPFGSKVLVYSSTGTTPPPTPTILAPTATAATDISWTTGFTANWGSVSGASKYLLDISINSGFTSFVGVYQNKEVFNTNCLISALSPNTIYYYRVRAVSSTGTISLNSNVITVKTAPAIPVAKAATNITSIGFTANWDAASGAEIYFFDVSTDINFETYVSGYQWETMYNTYCLVTGLNSNTTYYYRVRSYSSEETQSESSNKIIVSTTSTDVPPTPPVLTVSPTSLSFGNVVVGASSNEFTYNIQASNLIPVSGNIVARSFTSELQISTTSGTGFSTLLNIPYTNGTLTSKIIYAKFSPLQVSGYADTIYNTVGTLTKIVSTIGMGTVAPTPPVITPKLIVTTSILSFGNIKKNTSSKLSYIISGENLIPLKGNIVISSSKTQFKFSKSGNYFTSSISIPYTKGKLSATTVYVRFLPTAIQNYNATIVNAGGSATQQISTSGTGIK
jgi:hypothetical protein